MKKQNSLLPLIAGALIAGIFLHFNFSDQQTRFEELALEHSPRTIFLG
jgi:hypothetical protein